MIKTKYKSILVIAILFLSSLTLNKGYAHTPEEKKVLGTKDIQNLAPVTPVEIDFNDDEINLTFDIRSLVPTTPLEADFSDSL